MPAIVLSNQHAAPFKLRRVARRSSMECSRSADTQECGTRCIATGLSLREKRGDKTSASWCFIRERDTPYKILPMKPQTPANELLDGLRELYSAEKQQTKILPEM